MKHLKEQLQELQGAKDALTVSRTREDALQKQVQGFFLNIYLKLFYKIISKQRCCFLFDFWMVFICDNSFIIVIKNVTHLNESRFNQHLLAALTAAPYIIES